MARDLDLMALLLGSEEEEGELTPEEEAILAEWDTAARASVAALPGAAKGVPTGLPGRSPPTPPSTNLSVRLTTGRGGTA